MKFLKQVVLPIAILIGLIGGITFVAHFRGAAPKASRHAQPATSAPVRGDD
jgi:hypothetical protein